MFLLMFLLILLLMFLLMLLLISLGAFAAMPEYPDSWPLACACILGVFLAASMRTFRMMRSEVNLAHLPQFFAVASVYEIARAISLVIPVGHASRRRRA